jgi:hypothetical protein
VQNANGPDHDTNDLCTLQLIKVVNCVTKNKHMYVPSCFNWVNNTKRFNYGNWHPDAYTLWHLDHVICCYHRRTNDVRSYKRGKKKIVLMFSTSHCFDTSYDATQNITSTRIDRE